MARYEETFPVRYYETDQMSVVHHSNYIRYFEIARNRMMVDWGMPLERFEKEYGIQIPIVSVECRFKHPARMGDVLTAVAEIDEVPLAKLKVRQSVVDQDGNVCAEGSVVLGFIDARTFRPVRCPDVISEIIKQQLNNN